jgi:hypothetical protein
MTGVTLIVRKRAFPSQGRARIHESVLENLQIAEGDLVDLTIEGDAVPHPVAAFADSLVDEGEIRLSSEDMASFHLAEGSEVTVTKRPPPGEKIRKAAKSAAGDLKESLDAAETSVKSGVARVEEKAGTAASDLKEELKKAESSVKKGASRVSGAIRKPRKEE